jgi:predicted DsbA family dithiol-disulfide isomerase
VIEWSDFQCQFCARNEPTLARLRAEYPGQVRIVYRHLPLVFHAYADLAAEAAVAAAAQGKFWPMHDRIFGHQDRLTRADLEEDARVIGLDLPRFRAALDDRRYREVVAADAAAGAALGIDGTPTMFVNGSPIIGAVPWDRLRMLVDTKLAQARQMVAAGVAPADVYAVIMIGADAAERGDPSRMPVAGSIHALELGAVEREAAVVAACKGRDGSRAQKLADKLRGERRDVARGQCAAYGVDLP